MLGIGVCVDFFRAAHQLRQPAGRGVQLPAAVVQPADRERGGIAVIAQQSGLMQGAQRPAGAVQPPSQRLLLPSGTFVTCSAA